MPTQDDLQGAAMALVRLQETYRINMSDFSRGDVMGMPQGTSLTGIIISPLIYMINNLLAYFPYRNMQAQGVAINYWNYC